MKLRATIIIEYDPDIQDYEDELVTDIQSAITSDEEYVMTEGIDIWAHWLTDGIRHKVISIHIEEAK